MQSKRVWARVLGVEGGVVIEAVEYDDDSAEVVVSCRLRRGSTRRRGRCDRRCGRYDQGEGRRRWRALDAGTIRVFIEECLDVVPERHQQAGMAIPRLEAQLDGPIGDPGAGCVDRSLAVVHDPRHEVVDRYPRSTALESKGAFQALTRMASPGEMKASCVGLSQSWMSVSQLQPRLDGVSVQSGGWPMVKS